MPKRPIRPTDLLRFILVGDPQLSPSGDRVLFSRKTVTEKNSYLSHLWTVDLEGRQQQWTQGEKSVGQGRWSPDGNWIAFSSGRDGAAGQIYLIPTTGGEAKKLTSLPEGSVGEIQWSPDSSKIALTFRPTAEGRTEKAKKEQQEKGLNAPPLVFDDITYRLDGDGYFEGQRYELQVIDVAKAQAGEGAESYTVLTYRADPQGEYSFDWSPNSQELAVIHNSTKRPVVDPPNQQIYRLSMDGQAWKLEGLPKGSKSTPKWSPDGRWIAYAGDVDENDPWGTRNTKAYLVSAEGGEPKDLTGAQDYDLGAATLSDTRDAGFGVTMEWAPDGSGLFAQIGTFGETQLGFISKDGGLQLLTEGKHALMVGNAGSSARRIAAAYSTPSKLSEIAVIETEIATGRWVPKVLTDLNHDVLAELEIAEPEEIRIPTTDGLEVHGWVLKPIGYIEPKRYPAVLQIHGGPHAQYGWTFFHEFQCQAAEGYVVVYTNPRGSKGYGEAWAKAIQGDWGNKDWEDVQAVTRWMQHQPFIHPGQMAVMGGSYGGFMTNWVIGHTHDYKCAITDRCVSNMVSMAGNSDFPFNKDGYFKGVAWGDLDDIKELWRQSPIAYFKDVKTPTLIIHSAGDLRCNIEQSEQVFTALQMEGVESRMVRYPDCTSHGMSRSGPPDMRLHRLGEILGWLAKFLK
ncbi:MAG TPA: S9 family peptidase [Fimbriimonas sp.]|nr:S9 family peptidase [Fimbriimonas sp.]